MAPEHQGQAESITTDEIERAYDIAIMHAGHISNIKDVEEMLARLCRI